MTTHVDEIDDGVVVILNTRKNMYCKELQVWDDRAIPSLEAIFTSVPLSLS